MNNYITKNKIIPDLKNKPFNNSISIIKEENKKMNII